MKSHCHTSGKLECGAGECCVCAVGGCGRVDGIGSKD